MSFATALPQQIFGEEPRYTALRLDVPDIRAPLSSMGLASIEHFPGRWTWMLTADAVSKATAAAPAPSDSSVELASLRAVIRDQRASAEYFAVAMEQLASELRTKFALPKPGQ